MGKRKKGDFDLAIIGGGVSGCYFAYKVAKLKPDLKVALFECSDHVGGRLSSMKFGSTADFEIELGGMFFSDLDKRVKGLVEELNIPFHEVKFSREFQFLRGVFLRDENYQLETTELPFALAKNEARQSPGLLFFTALKTIIPNIQHIWPLSKNGPFGTEPASIEFLQHAKFRDRPLYDWGFWNVINQVVSQEAYKLLESTLGAISIFRNTNAYDAIRILLREIGAEEHYRLDDGYQSLPLKLWERATKDTSLHLETHLRSIEIRGKSFQLGFEGASKTQIEINADRVVLALPKRAIDLIDVYDGNSSPATFREQLNVVVPVPASKLFLSFASAWWETSEYGPGVMARNEISVTYTDLPMRQCYYFGNQNSEGLSVIMASYADDVATSFWSGLTNHQYCHGELSKIPNHSYCASTAMIEIARAQLKILHPDISIPSAEEAIFVDWSVDPFGGGWHAWKPYLRSFELAAKIRQPVAGKNLFICGESFSEIQGWVEGALQSADCVLSDYFTNENV